MRRTQIVEKALNDAPAMTTNKKGLMLDDGIGALLKDNTIRNSSQSVDRKVST